MGMVKLERILEVVKGVEEGMKRRMEGMNMDGRLEGGIVRRKCLKK